MPFIDLGTEYEGVQEAVIVPEKEYDLKCRDVEIMKEGGKNSVRVTIVHENPPVENPAPIFHYIGLPNAEKDITNDEAKNLDPGTTLRTKLLMAKRFMYAFSIPMEGSKFDAMDIRGATARIALGIDIYEGRKRNVLRLPNLPSEGAEATTAAATRRGKTA